jgi:hypothetical protein
MEIEMGSKTENQQLKKTDPGLNDSAESLQRLATIAHSVGVELNLEESAAWLAASTAQSFDAGEFEVLREDGIGGFELAVLDFDPASAARLRELGNLVATRKRDKVRVGLAIAGSAAQSKIQLFPADNDFFERVHIHAATLEEARTTLATAIREDVLRAIELPGILLDDVCFGGANSRSLRWNREAMIAGKITIEQSDGASSLITWDEAALEPGFIKVAWILIDPELGGPGLASKVIDATWQDPDGKIVSLDTMIDGEFQQVYLDADGAELASEVARSVSEATRARYVSDLEAQVAYYSRGANSNYAKVAKRLYNICRITGRFSEALYLRELFDEPPARLIQVETRLYVASRRAESDPASALAELRRAMVECSEIVEFQSFDIEVIESTADREQINAAITAALAAVSATATQEFAVRIRAFNPISQLLEDISSRFPEVASPHH